MSGGVHGVSPQPPAACTTEAQTDEQDEAGKKNPELLFSTSVTS